MKSDVCVTIAFVLCLVFLHLPLLAQEPADEPLINLSAANQPLAEVLDLIAAETGYQFNINRKWENHPVSATLNAVPLERGLKRLLRSLNYSIVWESGRIVTIMVYGKAEAGRDGGAISFAPPPREVPRDPGPAVEKESQPAESEETAGAAISTSGEDTETIAADAGEGDDDTPVESERSVE